MEKEKKVSTKNEVEIDYDNEDKRAYFKENFAIIRRSAGWSAEKFASLIGVSRQTINNIEHRQNKLSKSLYILSRTIIDNEIRKNPEDTIMTKLILDAFVDKREDYSDEERREIKSNAEKLTLAVVDKPENRKTVSIALVAAVAATVAVVGTAMGILVKSLFKK